MIFDLPALRKPKAQFDLPLAGAIAAILIIGLTNLYSATRLAPHGSYGLPPGGAGWGFILFPGRGRSEVHVPAVPLGMPPPAARGRPKYSR